MVEQLAQLAELELDAERRSVVADTLDGLLTGGERGQPVHGRSPRGRAGGALPSSRAAPTRRFVTVVAATDLTAEPGEVGDRIAGRRAQPGRGRRGDAQRIEEVDPQLNSYIRVSGEQRSPPRRSADAAIAAGYHLGPLHGMPIALKDNCRRARRAVERGQQGAPGLRARRGRDDRRSIRAAGAIFVGRLNMHELAYGVTTNNPHYGAARNPWDTGPHAGRLERRLWRRCRGAAVRTGRSAPTRAARSGCRPPSTGSPESGRRSAASATSGSRRSRGRSTRPARCAGRSRTAR